MQPTAVDFNAQQFFQTNITEVYFTSEVVQEGELAGFVGRLEHENFMTESIDEAVGICGIEVSVLVEEPDSAGALTSFDYQLQGSSIEPAASLIDQRIDGLVVECACVLLSQFELSVEAEFVGHSYYFSRTQIWICKTFSALDPGHADVSTEIQVSRQFALRNRYLKRAPSGNSWNSVAFGRSDLATGGAFRSNHPTGHRDFQDRHQMGALLEMTLKRRRIVAWIKRAGEWRNLRYADLL